MKTTLCRAELKEALELDRVLASSAGGQDKTSKPSMRTLASIALAVGLPFIGFGFFDNFIMVGSPALPACFPLLQALLLWRVRVMAPVSASMAVAVYTLLLLLMLCFSGATEGHLLYLDGCGVMQIIAGEEIENQFGAKLGLSTLAAAGLGNLLSDICGLGLADQIEARTFFPACQSAAVLGHVAPSASGLFTGPAIHRHATDRICTEPLRVCPRKPCSAQGFHRGAQDLERRAWARRQTNRIKYSTEVERDITTEPGSA